MTTKTSLTYSIRPIGSNCIRFCMENPAPPQLVRYDGEMIPVEEAVSLLLCAGHSVDYCFQWLERRMQVGRFAPREAIQ